MLSSASATQILTATLLCLGAIAQSPAVAASLTGGDRALAPTETAAQEAIAQVESTQGNSQRFRVYDVWQTVYERLPSLPLENQYIDAASGQPDTDNTLMNRLIRYHIFVKGRTTVYRLDWQMTLADYLGANDTIQDYRYPGSDTLTVSPLPGDVAAIAQLNRRQRNQLIDVLVSLFSAGLQDTVPPGSSGPGPGRPAAPTPRPAPAPAPTPTPPVQVGPGSADLLRF